MLKADYAKLGLASFELTKRTLGASKGRLPNKIRFSPTCSIWEDLQPVHFPSSLGPYTIRYSKQRRHTMTEYLKTGSRNKLWSFSSYKGMPNKILERHSFAKKIILRNNSKNFFLRQGQTFWQIFFDAVSEMHQNNSIFLWSRKNTFLLRLCCTVVSTVKSKSRVFEFESCSLIESFRKGDER